MHSVAVVRRDAADAPMHMHQTTVSACEKQQPAFARAVICERHLRESHALHALELAREKHAPTCTVRVAVSVWKLIT
jgi:hypothetical protein